MNVKHAIKDYNGVKMVSLSVDLPKTISYVSVNLHRGRESYSSIIPAESHSSPIPALFQPVGGVNFLRQHDLIKSEKSVENTCVTTLSLMNS